jgi:hypothetical protein
MCVIAYCRQAVCTFSIENQVFLKRTYVQVFIATVFYAWAKQNVLINFRCRSHELRDLCLMLNCS